MSAEWWSVPLSIAAGFLFVWLALLIALWLVHRRQPDAMALKDALRLVPDVIRLLRRLATDHDLPSGMRIRLALLLGYLLLPIDLVPDFVPVIGYADDAIVVALALRAVVRHAGAQSLDQHWPGTPEGLIALRRLAGIPDGR